MNYYRRFLLFTLTFVGPFLLTVARGAEFIPLEFRLTERPLLAAFQMSENGRIVSAEEALGHVHLWTAEDGVIDINRELRRETLSSEPLIARLSADGETGLGFMRGGDSIPFLWSFEDSTAKFIGKESGYGASSMSDDGSVVAGNSYGGWGGLSRDAFIWSEDIDFRPLSRPGVEDAFSGRILVSGNGNVVANTVVRGPFPELRAWQQGAPVGTQTDLVRWVDGQPTVLGEVVTGTRFGDQTGNAYSTSHDGSVIAGSGLAESSVGGAEVFRWTERKGLEGLGFEGSPHAMSSDGSVVAGGGAWNSMTPFSFSEWNEVPGFVWTVENGATFYDDVTFADITADGNVAVGREFEGRAVVWDSINGKRYLQDVLADDIDLTVELEGWTLTQAMQISDDGLTITGRGTDPSGDAGSYWLVSLDEPLYGLLCQESAPSSSRIFPGFFDSPLRWIASNRWSTPKAESTLDS